MDFKIELIAIPVTDVDRAKDFYVRAGFNADHDHRVGDGLRFGQHTPPGGACSTPRGGGQPPAEPGSVKGMQMVVGDIHAAREQLLAGGVEVSEVDSQAWGEFVYFTDPDGNAWAVQAIPERE